MLSALGGLRPPDQGLCPWTPLGALLPDPRYRLVLRTRHGAPQPLTPSAAYDADLSHCPKKKLSMDRQHAFHYSLVQLDLPETVLCVQKRPKSTFESTVLISQISCGVPAGACEPCRHGSHRIWPSGAKRDRRCIMLYAHASVSASNHRKRPKTPRVFSLMLLLQDGGQVGRVYICSRYLLIFSGLL